MKAAAGVRVSVRFFAQQRELLGRREQLLELPDGASVRDAWQHLVLAYPALDASSDFVRFARNGEYVDESAVLDAGDELAIIPPVSGGATDAGTFPRLALTGDRIDAAAAAALGAGVATPEDGALVTFVGLTRETPGTPAPGAEAEAARHAGERVVALEYEAYESMALSVLREIAAEIEERFGVRRLAILHRTGRVGVGEASVAIAVAHPRRGTAYDASRYIIEQLKRRVPVWKREHYTDGTREWVNPTASPPPVNDPR